MLGLTKGLINKFKDKFENKEFNNLCVNFNYYLKNLDSKGLYYFPFKVNFNGTFMEFNGQKCPLSFKFCEKSVKGEVIVVKTDGKVCFK